MSKGYNGLEREFVLRGDADAARRLRALRRAPCDPYDDEGFWDDPWVEPTDDTRRRFTKKAVRARLIDLYGHAHLERPRATRSRRVR